MEDVKGPLQEFFTDDPVNWVKWGVVFVVLIGLFVLSVKIYSKIEYKLSIQKKADDARAKGHVIPGAKRIKVRKKGTYQERKKSNEIHYSATYKYVLDGKEKEYRAFFHEHYPPEEIDLYYKNSPKKLFSVEEYYWRAPLGVFYLSLIFMPFVLAGFTAMALDIPFPGSEKGSVEVFETGAWKTGTIVDGEYRVIITCPEEGHPDGDYDWFTGYQDPQEYLNLEVGFSFVDVIPKQEEGISRQETVLWGQDILYETRLVKNRVWEDREQELFTGYMEVGSNKYLQITIFDIGEARVPAYMYLEDENFQSAFSVAFEKAQ